MQRWRALGSPVWVLLGLAIGINASSTTQVNYNVYEWRAGKWGTCLNSYGCGKGVRYRRVACIEVDDALPVAERYCQFMHRPKESEDCFEVCERIKPYLRWSVGSWSNCTRRTTTSSSCAAIGASTRDVQCLHQLPDGTANLATDLACKNFWSKPDDSMPCSTECPHECIEAEGGCDNNSSSCREALNAPSSIIVAAEPGAEECQMSNRTLCPGGVCPTSEYSRMNIDYVVKMGDWGPCLPARVKTNNFPMLGDLFLKPEIGITHRNVTCLNMRGEMVNMSYCTEIPRFPLKQRCLIPVDCELSPWSEWRVTSEGCINSLDEIMPEIRVRTRKLVRPPLGNGAPCGPLYEERKVQLDLPRCKKYQWRAFEWSDCVVFQHRERKDIEVIEPHCGGGVQTRNITCMRVSDSVPVDETSCAEPIIAKIQRCEIPCMRNCKVSNWSKWGTCLPLDVVTDYTKQHLTGYRKRSRTVVVSPSNGGATCPHLEEMDMCSNVLIANWLYGNWSECQLLDPTSLCGPGERTRDYSCVTFKGNPISEAFCEQHASYRQTTEACRVPCPNDCTLSEWSDWSPCSRDCSEDGDDGKSHRNRTVLTIRGPGGTSCHDDRREVKSCNRHSCTLINWYTAPWEVCQPHAMNGTSPICGPGTQFRKVYCRKGEFLHLDYRECRNLQKPMRSRPCKKPCVVDCALTKFSEWTDCPPSGGLQTRVRYIEKNSKHGGKACPKSLKQGRSCDSVDPCAELSYKWRLGPWTPCTLVDMNMRCGTGFQARSITCVDKVGSVVEMDHCIDYRPNKEITDVIKAVPLIFRLCQITCHKGSPSCIHSAWTSWTSCSHKYKAKRNRTREFLENSASKSFCKESFTIFEEEVCPYLPVKILTPKTEWSSCILDVMNCAATSVNGIIIHHHCGAGYRYRYGLQMKRPDSLEPGLERDLCIIECPLDCLMSEWTEWSHCNVPCGYGFRERRRRVMVQASPEGRSCPATLVNGTEIQKDVCERPCSDYRWLATGWGNCELIRRDSVYRKCGNGTQRRNVRCIEKRTETEVDHIHCDPTLRPIEATTCVIACPGECVLSEWITWKRCTQPCRHSNKLVERRLILRQPGDSAECIELMRKQPCAMNQNCFEYSWHFGDWGSCVLPEDSRCGEGTRRRPLVCQRSDGRQVDSVNCKKLEESPSLKKLLSKPCYQDCSIDCIITEWTTWDKTECRELCGRQGMMRRYRHVQQQASEAGQPCPTEVKQKLQCPFKPCYYWDTYAWSLCDMDGANCGYGVRRRLVRCLRYDGLQVDKVHCLGSNMTFEARGWLDPKWLIQAHGKSEEQECYIPCPGDCRVSKWSPWSHCHKDCDAGQVVGYQTSSRALTAPIFGPHSECNVKFIRTRPCWANQCPLFRWIFQNESLVCQRYDGLIVTGGGCKHVPRPCFPGCKSLPGGKCDTRRGICYCKTRSGQTVLVASSLLAKNTCAYPEPNVVIVGPHQPLNLTATTSEIRLKYYPDDNQVSFWMYAMISIGSAFVIFVAVTVYLMCRSSIRRRMVSVQRQGSVRRRGLAGPEHNAETNSYG